MNARLPSIVASAVLIAWPAAAEPLTVDLLSPALLSECDARAESYGRYAPPIAAAARALIDIGVFAPDEFEDVSIGFCGLRAAGGPVATASCADGVILLDDKYARPDQTLVLKATLAHEMKHHRQHRDAKARLGQGYCESARYAAEKPALEAQADAFGDAVGELFVTGRAVEIVNACDAPVMIYLEAADPVSIRGAAPAFQRIAPKSSLIAPERALSGIVRFDARTTPEAGPAYVWQDRTSAQTRFVEGRLVRPREKRLSAAGLEAGAYRLRLTCPDKAD
jgi:hypothetical protein